MAFYASFPLTALVLADRNAHRSRADRAPADLRSLGDGGQPPPDSSAGFRWWAVTILLLVATGIAARLACRRDERTVLRLHDSADHQRWDEVLRLATQVAPDWYSQYVTHDVHQALYHTGRLPFDMFLYPQSSEPFVLLTGTDPYTLGRRRVSDFHLWLGRVNDAEFHAHEGLIVRPSAEGFRQLARIAIIKGRVEVARLFLNVLRDDLVYGAWADACLRRLRQDPSFSSDAEVVRIRSGMVQEDDIHYATPPLTPILLTVPETGPLPGLLRQDPPNKMAFEYTMARYLVARDVDTVVRLLPQATRFAYGATPPLYEEAAMIYARVHKQKAETASSAGEMNGCRISEQTLSKIRELDAILASSRAGRDELSRVAGELGLEYFRYYYDRGAGS